MVEVEVEVVEVVVVVVEVEVEPRSQSGRALLQNHMFSSQVYFYCSKTIDSQSHRTGGRLNVPSSPVRLRIPPDS